MAPWPHKRLLHHNTPSHSALYQCSNFCPNAYDNDATTILFAISHFWNTWWKEPILTMHSTLTAQQHSQRGLQDCTEALDKTEKCVQAPGIPLTGPRLCVIFSTIQLLHSPISLLPQHTSLFFLYSYTRRFLCWWVWQITVILSKTFQSCGAQCNWVWPCTFSTSGTFNTQCDCKLWLPSHKS